MQIERFTDLSDDEIRQRIKQNREAAEDYRSRANTLYIQNGGFAVELDRRAVERLGLFEGDDVLKSNGEMAKIEHIGNYSGGLEYVIVIIDGKSLSVDEAVTMRRAYLAAHGDESEATR